LKKLLLVALWLMAVPLLGQARKEPCPEFEPTQDKALWRWMDRDCHKRTRRELDIILANHLKWLSSPRESTDSRRADLSGAYLQGAALTGAHLQRANLAGVYLSFADLTGAYLQSADLSGAHLEGADLTDANLSSGEIDKTHLEGAHLQGAKMIGAHAESADLTGAIMSEADLTGADLDYANLTNAHMEPVGDMYGTDRDGIPIRNPSPFSLDRPWGKPDLTDVSLQFANLSGMHICAKMAGAQLIGANLTGADLAGTDLTGANLAAATLWSSTLLADLSDARLDDAELWNADFGAEGVPRLSGIVRAKGLETLRWRTRPRPKLSGWRALAGWFATRSSPEATASDSEVYNYKTPMQDLRKELHDAGYVEAEAQVNLAYHRMEQQWWQEVLFDWTCEWGANWKRPLGFVLWMGLACSLVYWALVRFTRKNRLYLLRAIGKKEQRRRIGWRRLKEDESPWLKRFWWELRLYLTTLLFSLTSVLNLGVQGLDFGRWVRLIYRRDFQLEARGWIRAVAGIQSWVSVALLALALLSYLGHPIE
jgi:uncharacterized protein YjbI with pentapeptide repeats